MDSPLITDSIQITPSRATPMPQPSAQVGEEIDDSDFTQVVSRRSRKRKARPDSLLQDKNSHDKNMKPYGKQSRDRKNERKVKDKQRKHKDQQQNKVKPLPLSQKRKKYRLRGRSSETAKAHRG
eukprot:TRINITY_DN2185_c0_g1_i1.p1 TRINITY_DN2185_c0_g1~~TRINITY_DN2185_c0_g1_i1.p1  ORF type:complete len:124 (+),score=37.70 TRINITY_DN2185_c0_g1_i1:588-959(+)